MLTIITPGCGWLTYDRGLKLEVSNERSNTVHIPKPSKIRHDTQQRHKTQLPNCDTPKLIIQPHTSGTVVKKTHHLS